MSEQYIERINFTGSMDALLDTIADIYNIGDITSYEAIEIGYEDYNLKVVTRNGSYLVKIFASNRTAEECERYVSIIETVLDHGIAHPRLIQSSLSTHLHTMNDTHLRLVVMEWIDGETYYELTRIPTESEIYLITKEAAAIGNIHAVLPFHYDEWALDNIEGEFELVKAHLTAETRGRIVSIIKELQAIEKSKLTVGLVHGDLIKTNVMKAEDGTIRLLDFSVANNTFRINELAVLCCNLFFDETNAANSKHLYDTAIASYTSHHQLTPYEIQVLPQFVKAAHAMHVIGATKYELEHGASPENDYWKKLGEVGLAMDIYPI